MFPILVIIAGAALWLLTRKEAEVPTDLVTILPMPEPPPAPQPEPPPAPQPEPPPAPQPEPPPAPQPEPPPAPQPEPPPAPQPEPPPYPEVRPVPLYAVGNQLWGRDGHGAAVVATRWDSITKVWYYQLGSWSNWYREDELLTKPRPALSEWPENTTGQVMVRALDPQGQKLLITESQAQRIAQDNYSGWLLFGVVEPSWAS